MTNSHCGGFARLFVIAVAFQVNNIVVVPVTIDIVAAVIVLFIVVTVAVTVAIYVQAKWWSYIFAVNEVDKIASMTKGRREDERERARGVKSVCKCVYRAKTYFM